MSEPMPAVGMPESIDMTSVYPDDDNYWCCGECHRWYCESCKKYHCNWFDWECPVRAAEYRRREEE